MTQHALAQSNPTLAIDQLARLLLLGRKINDKYFDWYAPRETDEGHFQVIVQSRLRRGSRNQNDWFRMWLKHVVKILEQDIRDDYYTELFLSTTHPQDITPPST